VRMFLIGTSARDAKSIAIRYTTGKGVFTMAPYSHMALGFSLLGDGEVYYESYWLRDSDTGRTGVRGPLPMSDLDAWVSGNKYRKADQLELYYPPDLVKIAMAYCDSCVGKIGYSHIQLVQNLKLSIFGTAPRPDNATPEAWTCSEFPARVIDYIDPGSVGDPGGPLRKFLGVGTHVTFDSVTPAGKYGLWEAMEKQNAVRVT